MSKSPRTAALYVRVSTRDKQEPEMQQRQLEAWCRRQQLEVRHVYTDRESGTARRQLLDKVLHDAATGEFDVLVVWSLDRLSREGVLPTLRYLDQLAAAGVEYHSLTEPHFQTTGPFRELLIAVMSWAAQFEARRLRERIAGGLELARARGVRLGRPKRTFSDDERRRIWQLYERQAPLRAIAEQTGIPRTTIARFVNDSAERARRREEQEREDTQSNIPPAKAASE